MKRANPIALYYLFEYTRSQSKLQEILQFESERYKEIKAAFGDWRDWIKKKWLLDPNSFSFAHLEKDSENAQWFSILSWFVEVIQDHLLFLRAMQVETHENFKKYFSTRQMLLRTTFEDRL